MRHTHERATDVRDRRHSCPHRLSADLSPAESRRPFPTQHQQVMTLQRMPLINADFSFFKLLRWGWLVNSRLVERRPEREPSEGRDDVLEFAGSLERRHWQVFLSWGCAALSTPTPLVTARSGGLFLAQWRGVETLLHPVFHGCYAPGSFIPVFLQPTE